jgi:hypothetical protein
MIYLKTYFYTEHEVKFLKLNLLEAFNHIDKFIICEFNRTHTGEEREFIFDNYKHLFTEEELSKIIYLPCDISNETVYAKNDEDAIHKINEPIMRGYFVKKINLNDEDIIISVDADEIIYEHMYQKIINNVINHGTTLLKLHQFFYKINYHWINNDFTAPTAIKYSDFKNKYPCQLRYMGNLLNEYVGCHFSWCMTPSEMVYKLETYSHPQYRFCADINLLENAIKNKLYPFDSSVNFTINELSFNNEMLPKNLNKIL